MGLQYYKPWETTEDEDDIIRDQIEDAEDAIQRELEEAGLANDTRKGEQMQDDIRNSATEGDTDGESAVVKEDGVPEDPHLSTNNAPNGNELPPNDSAPADSHAEEPPAQEDPVNGETSAEPGLQEHLSSRNVAAEDEASKDAQDDNGEEVVEAGEDTVIY